MLFIRQAKHLASGLSTTVERLSSVVDESERFYEELLLTDPAKPEKARVVVDVRGEMRALQSRLYRRLLLPKLSASIFSHGGVRGRHIKSNAEPHLGSAFIFKTDISGFYPSIHHSRVYRLFSGLLGCSPDVARLCTKICTYRHHLALGLITSPILADQVLSRVDRRIGGACKTAGLTYTRYVDDITISGPFDLEKSGFARLVERVLEEDGFRANPQKHTFGRLAEDVSITGLREVDGHLDVRREYLDDLIGQLEDAARLVRGEALVGPYYTPNQILGRVRFVCWVNPGRRRDLLRRFRSIRWPLVRANARKFGYEATRKKLSKLKGVAEPEAPQVLGEGSV